MAGEGDRIERAGEYVLGLMSDAERERAERDLEIDPTFRDAVVRFAGQMQFFDRHEKRGLLPTRHWELVTQRLAELPQMRSVHLGDGNAGPATVIRGLSRPPYGIGLQALGGRRGFVVAAGLIVAFALGYLAGKL
ncbi:hypothetical protein FJ546_15910 [Mesorhizobium sp. B2-4-19]|uniref:hypothetical protein n=1 Tax=Mesorhizobium sp. B2-4-19 TaxID=2589930 RepID=UPI00112DE0E6|nr:hypothetical protein [Mesorhizobium sp. B2-4-19]TPK62241.1 hypothetical protein FJ546_15910 [Mesorhizobium sp. B2-4-19]